MQQKCIILNGVSRAIATDTAIPQLPDDRYPKLVLITLVSVIKQEVGRFHYKNMKGVVIGNSAGKFS